MSDILEKLSNSRIAGLVSEYKDLSRLPSLSKANESRLEEILDLSISDEVLDFALSETEHIMGHEFDFIDMKKIGDSQALLRERIGTDIPTLIQEVNVGCDEKEECDLTNLIQEIKTDSDTRSKMNVCLYNDPYLCPSI